MSPVYDRPAHEAEAVRRILAGRTWFDPFMQTRYWLACHRLVARGALVPGAIDNSFDIACRDCCLSSGYRPCPKHQPVAEPAQTWMRPMGMDEYQTPAGPVEHPMSFGDLQEAVRKTSRIN